MAQAHHQPTRVASKGLKGGSLGLVAVIVIGVASTAPGYSLAASIGIVTGEVGDEGAVHHAVRLRADGMHRGQRSTT